MLIETVRSYRCFKYRFKKTDPWQYDAKKINKVLISSSYLIPLIM